MIDTPILKGMLIYHNYIHEYTSLQENKTQVEKCRIEISYDNNCYIPYPYKEMDDCKK